ncbi:MAG: PAS domain S-box protein [Phormidium sp. GEM2.Bin31]|nr:MAG: PAS domain S-box protein [Phormidium sp. GEM2.Bin31]
MLKPLSISLTEVAFESLFNAALDAMLIADDDGVYLRANPAACQLFGTSEADLIGCSIQDFTLEEFDFASVWQRFLEVGEGRGEFRLRRADGEIRDVEYAATAHLQPHCHLSIVRDITARKQLEAEKRYLENLLPPNEVQLTPLPGAPAHSCPPSSHYCEFRQLIENLNDMVFTIDTEGKFSYISPTFESVMGYDRSELLGQHFSQFVHPQDCHINLRAFQQALAGQKSRGVEYRALHKGGDYHWHCSNLSVITNSAGELLACLGIARDIQEKKDKELKLEQLSQQLNKAQSIAHFGYWSFNLASQTLEWSDEVFRIFGMSPDQEKLDWEHHLQQCHPDDRQQVMDAVNQALQGCPRPIEHRVIRADGEVRHLNCCIQTDSDKDRIVRLFGTVIDVTEQKLARAQREAAFKKLSDIKYALDQAAIVAITDSRGQIEYINDKFSELCGYTPEEIIGKNHRILNSGYHPPEFFRNLWKTISQGQIWKGEICNKSKRCDCYWVDTTIVPILDEPGKPKSYLAIRFDITEQKRSQSKLKTLIQEKSQLIRESQAISAAMKQAYEELQETQAQLIQAEKMSSLGQLAAGIAHEINNPISFIYSNIPHIHQYFEELLLLLKLYQDNSTQPSSTIQEMCEEIDIEFMIEDLPKLLTSLETGAKRIGEIVRSLRTFSSLDEASLKSVDLHQNIDSTLVLLGSRMKVGQRHGIRIVKYYDDIPKIICHSSLLNQVFMNLFLNAIHAIEERAKSETDPDYVGTLTITTAMESSNLVYISVQDNGIGISPEVQAKIFNPFFTTKPVGTGTGMGLPICHQIITKQHKGDLSFTSIPGEGSEFFIQLRF